MFDINGGEFVIIAVLALLLVGPERIPEYVRGLRRLVGRAREFMKDTEASVRREVGDVDLTKYDPRQYDPRRIVREAFVDGSGGGGAGAVPGDDAAARLGALRDDAGGAGVSAASGAGPRRRRRPAGELPAGERAPFDGDAT